MTAEIGFLKVVHKAPDFPAITIPKSTWTTLIRIEYADFGGITRRDPGPSTMYGAVAGTLPLVLPKDIRARWLRVASNDATDITGLVVGTSRTWEAVVPAVLEYLSLSDFPLDLQLWSNGEAFSVATAIAGLFSPALYVVSRLTIGSD